MDGAIKGNRDNNYANLPGEITRRSLLGRRLERLKLICFYIPMNSSLGLELIKSQNPQVSFQYKSPYHFIILRSQDPSHEKSFTLLYFISIF
jgi:hypothetical protein